MSGQRGDGLPLSVPFPAMVYAPEGTAGTLADPTRPRVAIYYHSLAIKSDGTVWAWGYNDGGQLGDGTTSARTTPAQVSGLTDVIAVAAGYYHSMALKNDGTVWAWGTNWYGQLGDGFGNDSGFPVQVSGLTDVVAIAAAYGHSLAVKSDGTVWAWGWNINGQLGDGTSTNSNTPVQVFGLTDVIAVAAGSSHSMALKSDGTVWAWGSNYWGELGDGTTRSHIVPIQVPGLTGVTAIAAGSGYNLALKSDGTVWGWGSDTFGEVGNGTSGSNLRVLSPVQVIGLSGVTRIAAGYRSSLALKSDGSLWAWGFDDLNVLGSENYASPGIPVRVRDFGTSACISIVAGNDSRLAMLADNSVWFWGVNSGGQGEISATGWSANPEPVSGLDDVKSVQAGYEHSLALKPGGTVWAWGNNEYGQLGNGTYANSTTPVPVLDPSDPTGYLTDVAALGGSGDHTLALKTGGTVWAWGYNGDGELGNGTLDNSNLPVQVIADNSDPANPVYFTGVSSVAAGGYVSLAMKTDGTVWAWGPNWYGELGDGTGYDSNVPVQVRDAPGTGYLTNVTAIAAGDYHCLALKSDGTVWAWGNNYDGELGDGTTTDSYLPVQVSGLTSVSAIAAGGYHSLAVKSDGTVWAWGYNFYGELGDGTTTKSLTPVQVGAGPDNYLIGAAALCGGMYHSLAVISDGTVWGWGSNWEGELGRIGTQYSTDPLQIPSLFGALSISGGEYHSLALLPGGLRFTVQPGTNLTPKPQVTAYGADGTVDESFVGDVTLSIRPGTGARWAAINNATATAVAGVANFPDLAIDLTGAGYVLKAEGGGLPPAASVPFTIFASPNAPPEIFLSGYTALEEPGTLSLTGSFADPDEGDTWTVSANYGDGTVETVEHTAAKAFNLTHAYPDSGSFAASVSVGDGTNATTQPISVLVRNVAPFITDAIPDFQMLTKGAPATFNLGSFTDPGPDSPWTLHVDWDDGNTETATLTATGAMGSRTHTYTAGGLYHVVVSVTDKDGATGTSTFRLGVPPLPTGTLYAWGLNNYGQLGDGTTTNRASPVRSNLEGVTGVSGGGMHTLAEITSGTVWAWGFNNNGQLGNGNAGNLYNSNSPVQALGLSGVTPVAAGLYHSLALKNDGTVCAWGSNAYGQLGDGTNSDRWAPVPVSGIAGLTAIAAGDYFSLALKSDGTVWAWGYNALGQLGEGSATNYNVPVQVSGLSGVIAVAAGQNHSLALKSDGTVWAWGYNMFGQLGDGTTTNRYAPVQVSGIAGVAAVAAGSLHSLAVKNDGTVWAWGANGYGQLGDASTNNRLTAVQVSGFSNAAAVSGGSNHSMALKKDGTVWAWGQNNYGQLGTGTTTNSNVPVQVPELWGVIRVEAGDIHSLAVLGKSLRFDTEPGTNLTQKPVVRAYNTDGTVDTSFAGTVILSIRPYTGTAGAAISGNTTTATNGQATFSGLSIDTAGAGYMLLAHASGYADASSIPFDISTVLTHAPVVAAPANQAAVIGWPNSFALGSFTDSGNDGPWTVSVDWGDGTSAPASTTPTPSLPAQLHAYSTPGTFTVAVTVTDVTGTSGTASFTVAASSIVPSGMLLAWGANESGQLGDGTTTARLSPVVPLMDGAQIIAADASSSSTLALKSDGTAWAWGYNSYGQLGDGTRANSSVPVQVSNLTGVSALDPGYTFSLGLKSDGTAWAWGYNNYGQLGNGTGTNSFTPVQVSNLTNIVAIAAGDDFGLALMPDGTVQAWGRNINGQIGDGSTQNRLAPVQVPGLTGVVAISAGVYHAMALMSDGTVRAWGYNFEGEVGDGTTTERHSPVQVSGLSDVIAISGGYEHSLALKKDGTVWAWGYNDDGQLGDGTTTERHSPVQVSGLTGVIAISAGTYHSMALKRDGTVWVWGDNEDGQMGDGTTTDHIIPFPISGIAGAVQVSAGYSFSFAMLGKSLRFATEPGTNLAPKPVVQAYNPDGTQDTTFTGTVTLSIRPNTGTSGAALSNYTATAISGEATFSSLSIDTAGTGYMLLANATGYAEACSIPFDITAVTGHPPVVTKPSDQVAMAGWPKSFALGSFTDSGNDGSWNVSVDWGDGSTDTTFQVTATGSLPDMPHTYMTVDTYTATVTVADPAGSPGTATFLVNAALPPTGTLLAWGNNDSGQLGDGTNTSHASPVVSLMADARIIATDASAQHTLALKSDGTVWAWGSNGSGQLGNGFNTNSNIPVQVIADNTDPANPVYLTDISALAPGYSYSMALKNDGTVWAWGDNSNGQLGDGSFTPRFTSVQVSGLAGIVAIAAGDDFGMALKNDGTVWAWGFNLDGELGNGTITNSNVPVQVSELVGVISIGAGSYHGMALKNDGTVWAWGFNLDGELGNGTITNSNVPVQVIADNSDPANLVYLTGVIAVSGGSAHSMALKKDGTVWTWGDNSSGQLGDGTTTRRTIPVQVSGLTGVVAISAGTYHSMALRSDGTVWVWGDNEFGQMGDGTTTDHIIPVQMSDIAGAVQVSAGVYHSLALLGKSLRFTTQPSGATVNDANTPAVVVRAYNTDGTPDTTFTGEVTLSIRPYTGPAGAALSGNTATATAGEATFSNLSVNMVGTGYLLLANAAGYAKACSAPFDITGAVTPHAPVVTPPADQAAVVGWPNAFALGSFTDSGGEASWNVSVDWGDGTSAETFPVAETTLPFTPHTYTAVDTYTVTVTVTDPAGSADNATFAVTTALPQTGTLLGWGFNSYGQLGDGTNTSRLTPVVSLMTGAIAVNASTYNHSLAVKSDGTVWAWGYNEFGALGDGTTISKNIPIQVSGFTNALQVAGGENHSLVLKSDGTVWAWGLNHHGELGVDTGPDGSGGYQGSLTPIHVSAITDVTSIASGAYHSLALKSDGTVWAWGYNGYGQLGNATSGDGTDSAVPVQVSGLTGVTSIAGGGFHSLALKSDGTVWAWGQNDYGELGIGNTDDKNVPVQVSGFEGVIAIAAGGFHSLALKSDGTVWAWGQNWDGQLGNGTSGIGTDSNVPVKVPSLAGVTAISAGYQYNLALKNDGTVWAWGDNILGQLGNGTSGVDNISTVPVQVSGISGAVQVSAGGNHGFAILGKSLRFATEPGTNLAPKPVVQACNADGTVDTTFTGTVTLSIRPNTGTAGASLYKFTATAIAGEAAFSNLFIDTAGTGYVLLANATGYVEGCSLPFDITGTPSHAPVVTPPADQAAAVGFPNTFTLGSFTDALNDGPWNVSIAWGDGTPDTTFTMGTATTLPVVQHTYNTVNTFTVTVTVKDAAESPGSATFIVNTSLPQTGTLLAWGANSNGQLGDGTMTHRPTPALSLMTGATSVVSIQAHSLAVKSDGTIWTWGDGNPTPTLLPGFTNATQVAGSESHNLVLKSDGTVWAWGGNEIGQLGDGTITNSSVPVQVIADNTIPESPVYLTGVIAIAAGAYHSLALKNNGSVWAWGWNGVGQLGNGILDNDPHTTPTEVPNLTDVIAIATGYYHNLALKSDGTVWAWGRNFDGELGNGESGEGVTSSAPVQVSNLSGVTAISGGISYSLALKKDGTVWAWGHNGEGQLGNDTWFDSNVPVQVSGLTSVASIDAGDNHSLALKSDGTVWAWGDNSYGQLGDGSTMERKSPFRVPGISGAVQVFAGGYQSFALLGKSLRFTTQPTSATVGNAISPSIVVKAYNTDGTPDSTFAGDITLSIRPNTGAAGAALSGNTATANAGEATFSNLSVNTAGTGYMMLANSTGYAEACSTPFDITAVVTIHAPVVTPPSNQSAVVGWPNAFALGSFTDSGGEASWNVSVDWGDGTSAETFTTDAAGTLPVKPHAYTTANTFTVTVSVIDQTPLSDTATFQVTTLLAPPSGSVWGWGYNSYGQLGDGTWNNRVSPVLAMVPDAIDIAAGNEHSLALKPDGTVWASGESDYGKLGFDPGTDGSGNLNDVCVPGQVTGLTGIINVAAGAYHSMALKSDGTVWGWGSNSNGELGNGTTDDALVPVQITGFANVTAISAGYAHSLALKNDGTIWAWGYNNSGQLGADTGSDGYGGYQSRITPIQVSTLTNVIAIAAGDAHSLALRSDGTVWAWGGNYYGQLGADLGTDGDGYPVQRTATPVQVSNIANATAIAAGSNFSMALLLDGTVWTWGYNFFGQLGNGTTNNSVTPVQVSGLTDITAIAAGWNHGMAIQSGGTVWTWGYNGEGELGIGNIDDQHTPVQVPNMMGAIRVNGGGDHSFAIVGKHLRFTTQPASAEPGVALSRQPIVTAYNENGTQDATFVGEVTLAIAPGTGTAGAALSGTTTRTAVAGVATFSGLSIDLAGVGYRLAATSATHPAAISAPFDITSTTHAPVVTAPSSKTAVAGYQNTFQLGSFTDAGIPATDGPWSVSVSWGDGTPDSTFDAPSTGTLAVQPHAYAIPNTYTVTVMVTDKTGSYGTASFQVTASLLPPTGTLLAWGYNAHGQLGDGTIIEKTSPIVSLMAGAAAVDAGGTFATALTSGGTAWAWGWNGYGQLGDGTTTESHVPVQTTGLGIVSTVAAGGNHTLALDSSGALWAWGHNEYGQLGNGTTTDSSIPVRVITNSAVPTSYLTSVVAMAANSDHSLALKSDGTVWAWGYNGYRQLGDGTTDNHSTPIQVTSVSNIIAIAAGASHSLALTQGGAVWAWGSNWSGELGDGTTEQRTSPVQVSGLTDIIAIAAGSHSLALKKDGTVWAWGPNWDGQLGDGTYNDSSLPVQVRDPADGTGFLTGVTSLDTSGISNLALKSDGTIRAWGSNDYGELGNGSYANSNVAIPVPGIVGAIQVAAGGSNSFALLGKSLRFTTQPASASANSAISPAVVVKAYNTDGTLDTTFTGTVTLSIRPNTGAAGAALSNATASAIAGEAAFSNLSINTVGTGYMLLANATGYAEACSIPFDITAVVTHAPAVTAPAAQTAVVGLQNTFALGSFTDTGDPTTDSPWSVSVNWGDGTGPTTFTTNTATTLPVKPHTYAVANTYTVTVTVTDAAGTPGSVTFNITASTLPPAGTMLAWGRNNNGQLGDGTTTDHFIPVVSLMTGARSVDSDHQADHGVAVRNDGTVWAWGFNKSGQLGNGVSGEGAFSTSPVNVITDAGSRSTLTDVAAVSAGGGYNLALKSDGTVWAWGNNYYGQLGDGTQTNRSVAVQVLAPAGTSGFLTDVISISAGGLHSLAVTSDGAVWAWGNNQNGQLGDGTTTHRSRPVAVSTLTDAVDVSGGAFYSLALKKDGTVWAWGEGRYGQLGNGNTAQQISPVQVTGLTDAIDIEASFNHSLALKKDGTVWAWGFNEFGQLGMGFWDVNPHTTPAVISSLTNVAAIAIGSGYSLALKSNGTVWAWGRNDYGQMGIGNTSDQHTPVQVPGISGAVEIGAGYAFNYVVLDKSLRFTTQPASAEANASISPAVVVKAYNTDGTLDTTFAGEVTLSIRPNTGAAGAALSGYTATATAGEATFGNLSVNTAGTGYMLLANTEGYADACSTPFDVTTPPCDAPTISVHPQGGSVCSPNTYTFSVTAENATGYQWYHDTADPANAISGATFASYTTGVAGTYLVVVSNSCEATATSNPATLVVGTAPVISVHPQGGTICSPNTHTFSVTASGATGYQWYTGIDTQIPGATESTYTTGVPGTYWVMVRNSNCGDTPSNSAVLTVGSAPTISGQPQGGAICSGNPHTFTVVAGNATGYQWYRNAVTEENAIAEATSDSYITTEAGTYYVKVSNDCESVVSDAAVLSIKPSPSISTHPVGATICGMDMHTFSVAAENATGYQWLRDGNAIPDANGSTYTTSEAGTYSVRVSNDCEEVTSFPATLTVNTPPEITPMEPITSGNESGSCSALVAFSATVTGTPAPTVTYSIGDTIITSPHRFDKGVTAVTVTAENTCGKVTGGITVRVVDSENPSITCPAPIVQSMDPGQNTAVVNFTVGATDNCPGVYVTTDPPSGSTFPKGDTTVFATATDAEGAEATCEFTVTVNDTEKPVVTVPSADLSMECFSAEAVQTWAAGASATDNCDAGLTVTPSYTPPSDNCAQTVEVTFTARDSSGNEGTATKSFTIDDNTAPVLHNLPEELEITVAHNAVPELPTVTASDNCTANVPVNYSQVPATPSPCETLITRTWSAVDACENPVSATQTIHLTNTAPNISVALSPPSPGTNATLTATVSNVTDAESDTVTFTYVWKNDTTEVKRTTTTSTTDTLDLSVAGNGDRGDVITVEVTPNDGCIDGDKESDSVTVTGAGPTATLTYLETGAAYTDQTVQYSDPIPPALLAASDTDGDTLTVNMSGAPSGITLEDLGSNQWKVSGTVTDKPGTYAVVLTISDGQEGSTTKSFQIVVTQENALATYAGALMVTSDPKDPTKATVLLAATIEDITAVNPTTDSYAGDISHATVTFINADTKAVLAADVPVGLIDPADPKVGTAATSVVVDLGQNDSIPLTVGIVVNGWYTRDDPSDDTVVTVCKPIPNFITGGGYLVNAGSTGLKPGTTGLRTNFGFGVKYNKSMKGLQGRANIIVRSGGQVFQVKSNAILSLTVKAGTSTTPGTATFTAKASIQNITDPLNPITVDGNALLQITITDKGEPGTADSIAITLYNKSGGLWFASNWSGKKPAEQLLGSGNVVVR